MNLTAAILHLQPALVPNRDFVVSWAGQEQVISQWLSETPQPTAEHLAEAWAEIEPTLARTAVKAKRAREYPPMADYLDAKAKQSSTDPAVVSAGEAQEAEYLASCLAVKASNPFPN